eukprot:3712466-Amphidinium_carterae.1
MIRDDVLRYGVWGSQPWSKRCVASSCLLLRSYHAVMHAVRHACAALLLRQTCQVLKVQHSPWRCHWKPDSSAEDSFCDFLVVMLSWTGCQTCAKSKPSRKRLPVNSTQVDIDFTKINRVVYFVSPIHIGHVRFLFLAPTAVRPLAIWDSEELPLLRIELAACERLVAPQLQRYHATSSLLALWLGVWLGHLRIVYQDVAASLHDFAPKAG